MIERAAEGSGGRLCQRQDLGRCLRGLEDRAFRLPSSAFRRRHGSKVCQVTERVEVGLVQCRAYEEGLATALERVLEAVGGVARFVRPGASVLVKPNLLTDAEPDEAKTTHPEVVRHLVRLLRRHGARPWVADCPASVLKLERVWERTGFRRMCAEEDVPLVNLETGGSVLMERDGYAFSVARPVLEADAVVNVPKIKTHSLTTFTGAVKNVYGCIPGYQKTALHKRYFNPVQFGRLLARVYGTVRPVLTVADGIMAMDGNGPTAGRRVPLGLLAASADGVALDAMLCRLLQIPVRWVPYFRPLTELGLGETRPERIRLTGDALTDLRLPCFAVPNTWIVHCVPSGLIRWLASWFWIRPVFLDRCIGCGLCVRSCPAGALSLSPGGRPVVKPRRCLACCCCHEVCPQKAVELRTSPLFERLRRRDQCLRQDSGGSS